MPGLETDSLAGKPAFDVRTKFDKLADQLGRGIVENEREVLPSDFSDASTKVVDLALAREASPLPSRDPAGDNVVAISTSKGNMRSCYWRCWVGNPNFFQGSFWFGGGTLGFTRPRSAGVIPNRASWLEI